MNIRLLAVLAIAAIPLSAPLDLARGGQQPTPRDLFERARILEESNRNLDEAIALYTGAAQRSTDRELAAMAHLHVGLLHERLGRGDDARRAFRTVVERYGVQTPAGRQAAARLQDATAPAAPQPSLALRRIHEGLGLDWCNGLSADGALLTYPDWNTGNIALVDVRSGARRALTTTGSLLPTTAQRGEFGECTVISPDDRTVAFYWANAKREAELRAVGLDGSGVRTLYRADAATGLNYLQPLDWSPDGREILTLLYFQRGHRQLALIPAAGGSPRVIRELPLGGNAARFSPDGRYVAYAARQAGDTAATDLSVMTTDGRSDAVVVRDPADDQLLGWTPDGAVLLFASNRTGAYGVWSVALDGTRVRGAAALLKADVGTIFPIRVVKRTIYYTAPLQIADLYLAPFDANANPAVGPASPARPNFTGSITRGSWSPDGRSFVYSSFRGTSGYPDRITILDIATGTERHLKTALDTLDPYGAGPQWSPDGRSILVIARQQTPQHGLYRVDAQTGATTPVIVAGIGRHVLQAAWSRDGRYVFYTIGNDGSTRVLRRELGANAEIEMLLLPNPAGIPRLAVSPDGLWLAVSSRVPDSTAAAILSVIRTSGGPAREIYRVSANDTIAVAGWTPDSRYVLFRKRVFGNDPNAEPRLELWRVTPDGARSDRLQGDSRGELAFSPDGRRLAMTRGESRRELWALDLPAGAGAR